MAAKRKKRVQGEPLVILAGGGDFPLVAAEEAMAGGRAVLVVGIEGEASKEIEDFPHAWVKRGQLGRLFQIMKVFRAKELLLLGHIADRRMPSWREVDFVGVVEVLRHRAMLKNGDDTVLRKIAHIIEARGFRIVAPTDVAPRIVAREGLIGRYRPTEADLGNVLIGYRACRELGGRDVGQAVVAADRKVIDREDRDGTDALLERVARARAGKGASEALGVLVKCMKPNQDPRLDLPAIGPATIRLAAKAGLAGVAVEAGRTLILDEDLVVQLADRLGLFVMGFSMPDDRPAAGGA